MSNRRKYDKLARQRKEDMERFTASWTNATWSQKRKMDKFSASFAGESEPPRPLVIEKPRIPIRIQSGKTVRKKRKTTKSKSKRKSPSKRKKSKK